MRRLGGALAAVALAIQVGALAPSLAAPIRANAQRLDPYKSFRFRVLIGGHVVGGFARSSWTGAEVVEHRSGGDPSTAHKSPGRNKFEAITLERGLTHDTDFQAFAAGASRRDLELQRLDETGQVAARWSFSNCQASEYKSLPDLDAGADAIAVPHIKLTCEFAEAAPRP